MKGQTAIGDFRQGFPEIHTGIFRLSAVANQASADHRAGVCSYSGVFVLVRNCAIMPAEAISTEGTDK